MSQYSPWTLEHNVLHCPWDDALASGATLPRRLTFAILWDDGVVAPHPPIVTALARAAHKLVQAGHEVIMWHPMDHQYAWDLIVSILTSVPIIFMLGRPSLTD